MPKPGRTKLASCPNWFAKRMLDTDAVIIGAGPVGIYLAFQLGLLETQAHLIDALPHPGGQCVALYGDKPIYDIPGIPFCTGQSLVDGLLQQVKPFAPPMHFGQLVQSVERLEDGRFQVATNRDLVLRAKVVFIAGGAGAFVPRSPAIEGLSTLPPDDLQYALPERHTGLLQHKRHIVVLGDGDAALQAALVLGCEHGPHAKITLVHRRAVLSASAAVQGEFQAAIAAQSVNFIAAQLSGMRTDSGRLQSLNGVDANGAPIDIPCDHLLVLQGLSPKLGPIAAWGLDMERRQLTVDPETLATSEPGIYAVGDIISYPGKKKLIASGFSDAIIAGFASMSVIAPQRRVLLQYTSSSTQLQRLLGVL